MKEFLSKLLEIIDDGTTNIVITKDYCTNTTKLILDDRFKLFRSEMIISDELLEGKYGDDEAAEGFVFMLNYLWEDFKQKKTTLSDVYDCKNLWRENDGRSE